MTETQFYIFIGSICGFMVTLITFTISLSRTNASIRQENKISLDSIRLEMCSNHNDAMAIIIAIKDEMKDFHGRLCALEERKKLNG